MASSFLGCIRQCCSGRSREVILLLLSSRKLLIPHIWVLGSVILSPIQDKQGKYQKKKSTEEPLRSLRDWSISRMRLRKLGLFSLEGSGGLIQDNKHLMGVLKKLVKLFSMIPSDRTRGNGHKLRYSKIHLT